MSTQPPRKDHGAFYNLMRGLGRGSLRFSRWCWALHWKVKGPIAGVAAVVLLVAIGSAGGGEKKTEKASADATATVTVTSQATAAKATNTPRPANTAKPTNTPKPTSTPKPAETTAPTTAAPSAAAVQPTATAPVPTSNQPAAVPPTVAPGPTATGATVGYSLPDCYKPGQNRCNCADFSTQAYAQWFHNNYDQADVNKLDNNNDGVVCENNR